MTGFVSSPVMAAEQAAPDAPPMTLVCGSAEENYANNLALRDHLGAVGVEVGWREVRDGHTWTCWRDTLDPPPDRAADARLGMSPPSDVSAAAAGLDARARLTTGWGGWNATRSSSTRPPSTDQAP